MNAIKKTHLTRLKEHLRLGQIVQGIGFQAGVNPRGCSIGCTFDKYDLSAYETVLGIKDGKWLAKLNDAIFEGLPAETAPRFAVDCFAAIPDAAFGGGLDLVLVKWKFLAFLMRENAAREAGLPSLPEDLREKVLASIRWVLALYDEAIRTGVPPACAESAAWAASAESAACAASAESAACAASAACAESAARAARAAWDEWTARVASVESAAWAASAESAENDAYVRYAAKLVRLLREACDAGSPRQEKA